MSENSQDPYALIERMTQIVIDEHRQMRPSLYANYKAPDMEHCARDNNYHFTFLFDAASIEAPELFIKYVAWAKVLFKHLNIEPPLFLEKLEVIQRVCRRELQQPFAGQVDSTIRLAIEQFPSMTDSVPSFIDEGKENGRLASDYLKAILKADRAGANKIIYEAQARGMDIREIYISIFQNVQYEVGRQWQHRLISVAQEHYATAVSQHLMARIYPSILTPGMKKGSIVVTCVGNELHEMGARMVSDFLEMDGWNVSYLGSNTPTLSIISYLKQHNADLLMISATMSYNLKNLRELINAVRSETQLGGVRIVVGGYPFNQTGNLWRSVGADGYAVDAQDAVQMANRLGQ